MKLNTILKVLTVGLILAIAGVAYAAATAIPGAPALFQTVLSSPMGTSDTIMYLQSATLTNGVALTGYQCFTVSPQSTNTEYICGTMSGVTVTNLQRGLDPQTATTTDSTLAFTHRRGDAVQITTYPSLQRLVNIANGVDVFPNPVLYDASIATTTVADNRNNLATVGLLQDTAFNGAGIINASVTNKGIVQIATGLQAASSTALGSTGAVVVLPASLATSTWSASIPVGTVPAVNNSLTIDPNFLPASTTKPMTLATSTYIGSTYAFDIGKHEQTFTASSTWNVPNGIHKVFVRAVGAGGNACAGSATDASGAGSGGYAEGFIDVSGTTTVDIIIGSGVSGSPTTTTSFGYPTIFATGGGSGVCGNGTGASGGIGGIGIGGTFNSTGNTGQATSNTSGYNGTGAPSVLGQFGAGANGNNGSANIGQMGAAILEW